MEGIAFYPNLYYSVDFDLSSRICKKTDVGVMSKCLAYYSRHAQAMTNTIKIEVRMNEYQFLRKKIRQFDY